MFIYLHGFNSGATSAKATQLRILLAPIPVLAPTYPAHQVTEALRVLRAFIQDARRTHTQETSLVLVGSSLGGYYARYLAREMEARLLLINPSIRPYETLLRCVGHNHNDATGDDYELTRGEVQALGQLQATRCDPTVPTLLLLDEGDEVLDYREARDWYRDCGQTLVFPGGNHRFEHLKDAEPEIRRLHDAI
jgi:predicted esterase YcpF (UPF0227 family)